MTVLFEIRDCYMYFSVPDKIVDFCWYGASYHRSALTGFAFGLVLCPVTNTGLTVE